jgi:hypothetical protein
MTYPSKPSSAPAIPFNSVGRSKNLNDIFSAIAIEKLVALKTDGTYDDNFSIGDNTLNALVNEINIRQGSTIKEYDSTGANLLRTLTLGSATNLVQGFRYLDDPIKISNNATNPTTEIDVSAGIMTFDDGTGQVRLATSLTKSTANDFANGGLLPNSTVLQTDTMYYVFVIYSSASNLVSFYADTSKTSPTLPTSPNVYDKKQYRGAFYVDTNGNIAQFYARGNKFKLINQISYTLNATNPNFPIVAPLNSEVMMEGLISINQDGRFFIKSKVTTGAIARLENDWAPGSWSGGFNNRTIFLEISDVAQIDIQEVQGGTAFLYLHGWTDYDLKD